MHAAFAVLYTVLATSFLVLSALVIGTVFVLPTMLLPRPRRARVAAHGVRLFGRLCVWVMGAQVQASGSPPDASRGFLLICNHRSWFDVILLMAYCGAVGLSKAIIFWIPFVGFYGWLAGAVFFDRTDTDARARARREVIERVREGVRMMVFPEGTRSRDGALREKIYLTLVRDCYAAGVPVAPCAVLGTEQVLPPDVVRIVTGQRVRLHFAEPVQPEDFDDADSFAAEAWARVTRQLEAWE